MNVGKYDYKFLPLFIGSHVTIANYIIQIQNQVEKVQIALDSLKKTKYSNVPCIVSNNLK